MRCVNESFSFFQPFSAHPDVQSDTDILLWFPRELLQDLIFHVGTRPFPCIFTEALVTRYLPLRSFHFLFLMSFSNQLQLHLLLGLLSQLFVYVDAVQEPLFKLLKNTKQNVFKIGCGCPTFIVIFVQNSLLMDQHLLMLMPFESRFILIE